MCPRLFLFPLAFLALSLSSVPGREASASPSTSVSPPAPSVTEGALVGSEAVTVKALEEGFAVEAEFRAAVPPALAYAVLTDFDHMSRFVPNLEQSHIQSRNGNRWQVEQHGVARYGPFSQDYESVREILLQPGRIQAHAISGTAKRLDSDMQLSGDGRETRFHYHAVVVPDTWLPPLVGPAAMRQQIAGQFSALVREMLRRQAQAAE